MSTKPRAMPSTGASTMNRVILTRPDTTSALQARLATARPEKPANKGVRRAGGDAEVPGDEVPNDGAGQAAQNDPLIHHARLDHPLAHRLGYLHAEAEGRHEVEEGRPRHRLHRREHASGDDGGDGGGRVVEAVDVVEGEGHQDDEGHEDEGTTHVREPAARLKPS